MKRLTIVGVLLVLWLSGCTLKWTYDYADWVILWSVDDYFDLTTEQEQFLTERLDKILVWHRKEELTAYADFLQLLKAKGGDGLTDQEFDELFNEAQRLRINLLERVLPDTAVFLSTLQDSQILRLEEQLTESNEKFIERANLTKEERLDQRFGRTHERLEEWFGEFDESQIERISSISKAFPDRTANWLKNRQTHQKELVAFLRARKSPQEIEAQLKKWYIPIDGTHRPEYRETGKQLSAAFKQIVLDLDKVVSPMQRINAASRIDELINDMKDLASSS